MAHVEPLPQPTGPRTAWAAVIEAAGNAFPELTERGAKAGVTQFIADLHTLGWTIVPARRHYMSGGE